ncbi:hypothetical protein LWI29_028231 [Acer saccharum]|uniref:Uncharacterized protein n=1 Tax=Acer saccharum TaxID=4024 RepID=A0AA39SHG9_ACESA|nr:hypothetical protein LWI29_028231 [Acer saccharum]
MNYEDFLLKPKDKWITKSTTNVYCNLNGLPDIVKVLRKVGDLAAFRRTCFGHLIDIPKDLTFSSGVLHNLLLRQVHVPGVTGQNEFHFSVGGKLLKFTQREFCLHVILEELHPTVNEREQPYLEGIDTNLSDGPQFMPDNLEEDDGREGVDFEVGNDDNDGGQSRPQQKKRKRSPRKQKITPNTKRQRTSGDTSPVGDESTVSSQTRQLMKEMSDRFEDIVKKEISAMERRIKRRLTRVEKSVDQLVDARRETIPEVHNFSTPQHQYDHRGISSPLGGGDDLHGGRDSTHGGGVGDDTHGQRDGTLGGGDSGGGGGVGMAPMVREMTSMVGEIVGVVGELGMPPMLREMTSMVGEMTSMVGEILPIGMTPTVPQWNSIPLPHWELTHQLGMEHCKSTSL